MHRRAVLAAALVAVLGSRSASAEDGINAIINGNVSATDNAFQDGSGNKHADAVYQIRPGVLFGYETRRATYTAAADMEATDYVRNYDQFALTVHGRGNAGWALTPLTDASASVTVATGKTNVLAGRQSPDQNVVTGLLPGGAGDLYQVDGGQGLTHTITRTVRVSEGLAGDFLQNNGAAGAITRSMMATGALQINKGFEENAIGIDGGASIVRLLQYTPGDPMNGIAPTGRLDRQLVPRASAYWRHDISRKWSGTLAGGFSVLIPYGQDPYDLTRKTDKKTYAPTASIALNYTDLWGYASIAAGHYLAPNLLIAQNTITDSVAVSAAVPLVWVESHGRPPRYTASGSLGAFRTQLIDSTTNGSQGSYTGEHVDVGVAFQPRPNQSFALRYTFAHQTGNTMAIVPIPALVSNTVSFVFTLRYPERIAVPEPKKTSVRADESDLRPFGAIDGGADTNGDTKDPGGNAGGNAGGTAGGPAGGEANPSGP